MLKPIIIFAFALIMVFTVYKVIDTATTANIAAVIGSEQRIIYAECISSFSSEPLQSFIITSVHLNEDRAADALVQYKSGEACGSAGCVFELCVSNASGSYEHIPFGFAAKQIELAETMTGGMKDLLLNGDKNLKMNWNGETYLLSTD